MPKMSTNPETSAGSVSHDMPIQTISTFIQNIFQKYGLSEIAITDIDEKKFGSSVIDLENTNKGELASTIITYISYYVDQDLYDEELFGNLSKILADGKDIILMLQVF